MFTRNLRIHASARSGSVRIAIASLAVGVLVLFTQAQALAQYMYLDSNGNGVHDVGDRLRNCPTQVDVWLDTEKNRDGTLAVCPFGAGALNLSHYEFVLQAVGGTVTYGAMTNLLPGSLGSLARDARDITGTVYYHNGAMFSVLASISPGLHKLATLTVAVATGAPRLDIISKHPANGTGRTSFGSECPATAIYDHMNRHGVTWSDVDGLTAALAVDTQPVAVAPGMTLPLDGDPVEFTVFASDVDADPITTFTADFSGLPIVNDAVFITANLNTTVAKGTFLWTPTLLDEGDYEVTFTATNCLTSLVQTAIIHVIGIVTGVEASGERPINFLAANQPNPFAPNTTIDYSLEKAGDVRINVYSASGRSVRTLVSARMPAGPQRVSWNGTDDAGRPVASGVYWCRMESGSYRMSRRMILLR